MKKISIVLFLIIVSSLVFATAGDIKIYQGENTPDSFDWYAITQTGANYVTAAQWKFENTLLRDVKLTTMILDSSGTGNDTKMNISIYEDTDGDGKYLFISDDLIAEGTYATDDGFALFNLESNKEFIIPANSSKSYFVVYQTNEIDDYGGTYIHTIDTLVGENTSTSAEVTGTYVSKMILSPTTTYHIFGDYFIELTSQNGLMAWTSNIQDYSGHMGVYIQGQLVPDTSLTSQMNFGCGTNKRDTGYVYGGGGQYNITLSSPIFQKMRSSYDSLSNVVVVMRSTQTTGTDDITMVVRKDTIDGEIIGEQTITVNATNQEKKFIFTFNDCAGDTYCGNQSVEAGEECENLIIPKICDDYEGYFSGELSCTDTCTVDYLQCNNMEADLGIQCTNSGLENATYDCTTLNETYGTEYISGTLTFNGACDADLSGCEVAEPIAPPTDPVDDTPVDNNDPVEPLTNGPIDPPTNPGPSPASCGNGIIELGEYCEVGDLQGASCTDFDYDKGILGCNSNCNYDTSNCVKVNEQGEVIATGSTDGDNLVDNNLQTGPAPNETNLEEGLDIIPFAGAGIIIIILIGIVYYFTSIKSKVKIVKKK